MSRLLAPLRERIRGGEVIWVSLRTFGARHRSAYQIEGASNLDGKGPSVQDIKTVPADSPDFTVCSDHYHRYKEDVALFAELGLTSYRFDCLDAHRARRRRRRQPGRYRVLQQPH